jgi:hypothetical protein
MKKELNYTLEREHNMWIITPESWFLELLTLRPMLFIGSMAILLITAYLGLVRD